MARLKDGERIGVQTEYLGSTREVAPVRRRDFYCDTPTRLHKHAEEAEMRACIEREGYASDGDG